MGYIASLFIGVSLGLLGTGGSILTVPVMVYLFHVPVRMATSYSLFVVGATGLMGAACQWRQGNVAAKTAVLFCLVSMSVVALIRNYVLPVTPARLFNAAGHPVTSSLVSLLLFSVLMLLAAYAMIRRKKAENQCKGSVRR